MEKSVAGFVPVKGMGPACSLSPCVMHKIGDGFLAAGWDAHTKFTCMAVGLVKAVGAFCDFPIHAAIHVLDGTHFDSFFLMIAQLDFEGLIDPVLPALHSVVRLAALTDDIECIAGKDAQGLIGRCVADHVFARKLELSIVIATIKTHATL